MLGLPPTLPPDAIANLLVAMVESADEIIEIYRYRLSDKKAAGESCGAGLVIRLSHPLQADVVMTQWPKTNPSPTLKKKL